MKKLLFILFIIFGSFVANAQESRDFVRLTSNRVMCIDYEDSSNRAWENCNKIIILDSRNNTLSIYGDNNISRFDIVKILKTENAELLRCKTVDKDGKLNTMILFSNSDGDMFLILRYRNLSFIFNVEV